MDRTYVLEIIISFLELVKLFLRILRYFIKTIEASCQFRLDSVDSSRMVPNFLFPFQMCVPLVRKVFGFRLVEVQVELQEDVLDNARDAFDVSFVIAKKLYIVLAFKI